MVYEPNIGYMLALIIVAVGCVVLVLWPGYDDNLLQRIGAGVVCLSAAGEVNAVLHGLSNIRPTLSLAVGVFIIGLGTLMKLRARGKKHVA